MFEEECRPFIQEKTPITDVEYAHLLYVRKSGQYPPKGTDEWTRWLLVVCRFHDQYPTTLEREAWHEAGHVVVGHRLGWRAMHIERHPDGHPFACVPPPCSMPPLGFMDWATVKVAGYLAEHKATGKRTDPTEEPAEISKFVATAKASVGDRATPWECIRVVQQAEREATGILNAHWSTVQAIAELVLASLPVPHAELVHALRDVPQLDHPCDGSR